MDDSCLEFSKYYREQLEKKFHDDADNYFEDLVKKSGVNVEENRATVKEYNAKAEELKKAENKHSSLKGLKGFLIFLSIAGFICAVIGLVVFIIMQKKLIVGLPMTIGGVVLGIVMIIIVVKVIKPKLTNVQTIIDKLTKEAQEILNRAWEQMAPLNSLFDRGMTKELIEKSLSILKVDENFNVRRLDYLSNKYRLDERTPSNKSTIGVFSGEIQGNPFVVRRFLNQSFEQHVYTGTLTIHWTTTIRVNGKTQVQHHTQVLTAHVTKPAPYYFNNAELVYGNDAAPNLSFTHSATHAEKMDEKELEKFVKKGAKEIQSQARKSVANGGNFTEMGNETFDVLFNATDRNNEVEFRLLFTPLAQKNMIDLMTKSKYGDDFNFLKNGQLNFINAGSINQWDFYIDVKKYKSYDVDDAKQKFVGFNCSFFEHLCTALAPVMSIPLYQQQKPREYIYKKHYATNITISESECLANKINAGIFANDLSKTQLILKTDFVKKNGKVDLVNVTANSFTTQNRVDLIPVLGGDGRMHSVPVPWIEYIPVEKCTSIGISELDMKDQEYAQNEISHNADYSAFAHGIFAYVVNDNMIKFNGEIKK